MARATRSISASSTSSANRSGSPAVAAGRVRSPTAQRLGAHGIQVGTAFAFCRQSGLDPDLRRAVLARVADGTAVVRTDPRASPTGFPFKVVELPETLSEDVVYTFRQRVCNLGFLRSAYRRPDGRVGYRCPAEPVLAFVAKGGAAEQTVGRKCLCNGLLANISLAEAGEDGGGVEPPLLTAGDDLVNLWSFLTPDGSGYGAEEVLRVLAIQPA